MLSLLAICLLETDNSNQRVGLDKKGRKFLQDMFFCGKADAQRHEVTQFLSLKETVEEMGMGDSGFLALPQEPRNTRFSSLLSKQQQTTVGKKLPGKRLKISLCSKQCVLRTGRSC